MSKDQAPYANALQRARDHSPFLARALAQNEALASLLEEGRLDEAMAQARAMGMGEEPDIALRKQRLAHALVIAIGDLAGQLSLSQTVAALTRFADYALDTAIRVAIAERIGRSDRAAPEGFIALALGKQGAGELNYSSDIDPIFLYDPETLPRRADDDPAEAAQRYTRRILKLLSHNTQHGYVVRVDLRLRPASEISPLALSRGRALSHYQSDAIAWERAAFTRARAAAGDIAAGEAFLEEIRPFIWRHSLDFGAVEEIRSLTKRIRESYDGPLCPGPGFDVKRGRGGIREIEFIAQTHQLIHGGRNPELRVRGMRAAFGALSDAGHIPPDQAELLANSYDRLRVIEHRLQMMNDRQTHVLPAADALEEVAMLDGLASGSALIDELTAITGETALLFEDMIGADSEPAPPSAAAATPQTPASKETASEEQPPVLLDQFGKRIARWSDGRYQTLRSDQALAAFDELTPALVEALAKSDDPDRAITRFETLLERAASAVTLFRLLNARRDLLDRLIAALTLTPILADELARRPELLDILLEPDALEPPGSIAEITERIERARQRDDYEALLDAIRLVTGELRFALGVQLIEGLTDPLEIGAALSRIAEAALIEAHRGASAEFARSHGTIDGSELLVLGLGRFGGGALTHASDLDVVYLFSGDFAAQSDGPQSLGASHYFNRLAGRVSAALSVPTAQGALYEVDTRLRPLGAQGPLATSCEAFAKYHREAAWTWEHMALARARVLVGSSEARADLEAIMTDVLRRKRDPSAISQEVTAMRAQMANHKPASGPLDVKRLRGGLVDCEFLVHFFQLRGTDKDGELLAESAADAFSPDLADAIPALIAAGLLPANFLAAYDLMSRLLVASRLLAPQGKNAPPSAARALAKACGCANFEELLEETSKARAQIRSVWKEVFGAAISDPEPAN